MEGAGEDPYLSSKIAAARVRGFQGTDLSKPNAVAACVKHFAAYGFSEGGRDYNTVDMSDHRLREIVLPPFEAAAKEGAATFMNAFNTLNGTPASMNHYLLKDILRQEWGFKGMVVSDWNSIGETITHGAAADEVDAAAKCLSAGSDMDMAGTTFQKGLKIALINGKVTQKQLDDAVRNVLRLKFQLGLFDDPFRRLNPANRKNNLENPSYRQTAREAAQKSMVLLRNNGGILPLTSQTPLKRILIVGPFADNNSQKDYLSFWTLGLGTPHYDSTKIITPAQALKPALEAQGFEVTIRAICKDAACTEIEMDAAVKDVRTADVVIICVGEHGLDCGESRSVADINLRNAQEQLIKRMTRTNKPAIMVLFNSRPLTFDWAFENMQGILVAWQPGFETGNALADIITGKVNPSGKLPMTFPKHVGQIPLYYNALKTGRPQSNFGTPWTSGYLDMPSTPAFPFGYGIGYSRFVYSEVKLSTNAITQNESLDVSVNVTNTGSMDGEEVVQLYINDPVADVARPVKELKGFQKIFLPAGKSQIVHFKITKDELAYWNDKKEKKADPGTFTVFIGGNSQEVKSASFELK
jgi:beta-glucosidase